MKEFEEKIFSELTFIDENSDFFDICKKMWEKSKKYSKTIQ